MTAPMVRTIWALALISLAMISAPLHAQNVQQDSDFQSDLGVMLSGSLEKPQHAGSGPFAVAIIIPGAGPWTRGGSWDFQGIRARLLANGIATFRYDKRGLGKSTGEYVDTLSETERDAAAAIAYLRTRKDIDPDRIALIGHSQGAAAVPVLASRDQRIAALVMLSGPVGRRGKLFIDGLANQLATGGRSKAAVDRITAATGRWLQARSNRAKTSEILRLRQIAVDAFAAGGFTRKQARGAVGSLDTPLVLSMFETGIQEALEKAPAPALVIYGSSDPIVSASLSIPVAETVLEDRRSSMVVVAPGLGHGLQPVNSVQKAFYHDWRDMAPVVSELVGDWLSARLRHNDSHASRHN